MNARYFWVDDVFATGILAEAIHVERSSVHSLLLDFKRSEILMTKGPKEAGQFIFGYQYLNHRDRLRVMDNLYNLTKQHYERYS